MMLTRRLKLIVLIVLAVATPGCIENEESNTGQQVCSSDWYLLVEKQTSTGDSQGHGPDLGVLEILCQSFNLYKRGLHNDREIQL